jgi:hypothetical protein
MTAGSDTERILAGLGGDPNAWMTLERLAAAPPADLIACVRRRYTNADPRDRRFLVWLLGRLPEHGGEATARDWLRAAAGHEDAAPLLELFNSQGWPLSASELERWLASGATDVLAAAVAAAGASGDAGLAARVAVHLDNPRIAMHAAIALGRLRATRHTSDLVARLPTLKGLTHAGFVVALELMNDPTAVPGLREWLARAPDELAWDVQHALYKLTGRDPLLPLHADRADAVNAIRAAWAGIDLVRAPAAPSLDGLELRDAAEAAFVVRDGRGLITIEYDPPPPGSSWPRWNKSLRVGGQALYAVGSDCGTCETTLRLTGWPAERAAALAASARDALRDVASLGRPLFDRLAPLLGGMRSGHYLATLADLDLERVASPEGSWCSRRYALRDPDAPATAPRSAPDPASVWPGVEHHQLRDPVPGEERTFGVILPSQAPSALTPETVDDYERLVRAGGRPAALVLAWAEAKEISGEVPERFLVGVVLDGHHKLAAYARAGIATRAILICRLEDTWGPPEDRGRYVREATAPLKLRDTVKEHPPRTTSS